MIPRTFPSTYASNGQQQMVVYFLPSIAGLRRWLDYIPVKLSQGGVENSYANNGYIDVTVVSRPTATQQAWKEYIPVYLDDAATDAWRVNATGYIPYGYALFGGASMIMDMTNTGALDSRVTFSRTSNATQFDSSGNLVYAPHNLLTFSEQFDNAAWVKFSGSVTANAVVSPDGTTTADTFVANGISGLHRVQQTALAVAGGGRTFSVYAKAGTNNFIQLFVDTDTAPWANFNLASGTVGSQGTNQTATIVSAGNGWFRCTLFSNSATATGVNIAVVTDGASARGETNSLATTVHLWGAQLNIGTLQPYYPTTVKNLLGFTQEFDNAAWTKSNSFVQTNQIRNNTMQGAVAGTPGTLPTNWSVSGTATSSVIGAGTENGISYIDVRFQGAGAADAFNLFFDGVTQIAALNGQSWTGSFYLKLVGGSVANLSLIQRLAFRNSGGANIQSVDTSSLVPTSAALSTQRTTLSLTAVQATTAFVTTALNSGTPTGAFDITIRIGWPQLVQGAVAGDPVATYGTARAVMYPAPDGSVTGDKLVEDTAAGVEHRIGSVSIAWTGNGVYSTSFYVKAAGRFRFDILFGTAGNWVNGDPARVASFNLQTGTVSLVPSSPGVASIVSVGDGWYRCRVTATATAAPSASGVFLRMADSTGSATYTGNGTDGILIWGAQLSDSASLDPYVYNPVAAPTAAAYYGPRFDYDPATLAARGLLIEEQRTNSIRNNTMQGASAPSTLPTNWLSNVGGLTLGVVGTGTENGIAYIDVRFSGTPTQTFANVRFEGNTQVAAANGQTWTSSFYARMIAGSLANIGAVENRIQYRDIGGASVLEDALNFTSTVSAASLSAARRTYTLLATSASTAFINNAVSLITTVGQAIDITLRIGLPQLELGAFATSVIPTTTAAATRTADVATMVGANFSNWYRQDEGTLFGDVAVLSSAYANGVFLDVGAGGAFGTTAYMNWSGSQWGINPNTAPVNMLSLVTTTSTAKTAAALAANNTIASANGLLGVLDTSCAMPLSATTLSIGRGGWSGATNYFNGHIRRIAYYPTRLSNAQLQAVTA